MHQSEVSEKAGCSQAYISRIESGWLPKNGSESKYASIIQAYGLRGQEDQFLRMVNEGKRLNQMTQALQTPAVKDFPLMLFAASQGVNIQPMLDEKLKGGVA